MSLHLAIFFQKYIWKIWVGYPKVSGECSLFFFLSPSLQINKKTALWLVLQLSPRHFFIVFHCLFPHISIRCGSGLLIACISMHCRHIHQHSCTYGCHSVFCTEGWILVENISALRLPLANLTSSPDQRPLLAPPGARLGLCTCWLHEYLTEKLRRGLLVIHLLSCWSYTRDELAADFFHNNAKVQQRI